ncbi:myosin heavy chain, muscle-like protein [Lates japonicus]|uniref:Myosin heavy chain, muscle-like protein n=1 Tax=Lates japonicus TaxID=270547 RepID=A0AAD3NBA9_LATJO|nr:myosin heavy chain, muscle-like protein [Lates japonicus]
MIWFCKHFLLVSLLTFFFYRGLSLVRIYGDEITNIIIMHLSRSASVAVGVTVGVTGLLFAAGVKWRHWGIRKKRKAVKEELDNLKGALDNKVKSLEDEEKEIFILTNLAFCSITRILENQKEQVKVKLTDLQAEIEKIREKLQSVESEITECERRNDIDRKGELLKEKQRLLNELWRPERKKAQLERQQLTINRPLQDAEEEDSMRMMTERIFELKNDIQQLKEQLEKKKKEGEGLQKQLSCLKLIIIFAAGSTALIIITFRQNVVQFLK